MIKNSYIYLRVAYPSPISFLSSYSGSGWFAPDYMILNTNISLSIPYLSNCFPFQLFSLHVICTWLHESNTNISLRVTYPFPTSLPSRCSGSMWFAPDYIILNTNCFLRVTYPFPISFLSSCSGSVWFSLDYMMLNTNISLSVTYPFPISFSHSFSGSM